MRSLFLVFGVVVHLVLLYSIFDIYYSSPLVQGAQPHPIIRNGLAPAARLVLFSADGLRSKTFFEHPDKSPFLNGLIRNRQCSWGISRSHVPTESRPGHVALMAGFHEDVSAVAKGWKHNPIPFDSTLNRSSHVWMWGSPDIISIFVDTLNPGVLVLADSYSSLEEDFASKNAAKLDEWVFERVEAYFLSPQDQTAIHSKKAIFFLHLIGLDTNGHGNKPKSASYIDNIYTVDKGVQKMVELFENTYKDNRTAYLFTADHGMTDWGSHGAGTDDEILTPFLIWGAGVKKSSLKLSLNQIDLTPLQSALLGLAVPVNNMGILPLSLLDVSPRYKFLAAYGNFKQMKEQYRIRRTERLNHSFFFRDFPGFQWNALEKVEAEILRLANGNRFDAAASACLPWISRVRDALMYFHRYQRFSLGLSIVALYLNWNLALYSLVTKNSQKYLLQISDVFSPSKAFTAVLCVASWLIWLQHLRWTNYLYYLMPIYTASIVYNLNWGVGSGSTGFFRSICRLVQEDTKYKLHLLINRLQQIEPKVCGKFNGFTLFAFLLLLLVLLCSLVAGFLATLVGVFLERSVLSVIFICLSPVWLASNTRQKHWNYIWLVCCLVLAIFPQLDTVGSTPQPILVVIAPFLSAASLNFYCYKIRKSANYYIFCLLTCLHLISGLLNAFSFLSILTRLFSWLTIPLAFLFPLLRPPIDHNLADTLIIWQGSLFLPFSMLTTAYESIFLLIFSVFLLAFVRLEIGSEMPLSNSQFFGIQLGISLKEKNESITNEYSQAVDKTACGHFTMVEWRRAVLLIAMIEMAFFGTGNIASLNSFNTSFLQNFTTVFSPFLMASLLLFKILVPFLQLALAFAAILHHNSGLLPRLSVLMMLVTDCMAIVFFYRLKDEGSWLDIGLSISNYVICLLSSIIVFLLLHVANRLLMIRLEFQSFISQLKCAFSKIKILEDRNC